MTGIDREDITAKALALGWTLPGGWRVMTSLTRDDDLGGPGDAGDAFLVDHPGDTAHQRTHAFCEWCEAWIRKLDDETIDGVGPNANGREARVGDWADLATGIDCPGVGSRRHKPAPPLPVTWWREDRWTFVIVDVRVVADTGLEWGQANLGGMVSGQFPHITDTYAGTVEARNLNPYSDEEQINQLIHDACEEAQTNLAAFIAAAPALTYTPPA